MSSSKEKNNCLVCAEKYNKTNKKKIVCKCGYECCRTCFKTYMLSKNEEPNCMNCRHIFTRDFLYENLEKCFINNEYKSLKENILYEKEKMLFPFTQAYIVKENEINEVKNEIKKIDDEVRPFKNEINDINDQIRSLKRKRDELNDNIIKFIRPRNDLLSKLYYLQQDLRQINVRNLIQKCPNENCQGYLSENFECGLCHNQYCDKCKNVMNDENHICDSNVLKNIEFIKNNTNSKPCPKCNIDVWKTDGCSDMYCTACKTFFKWNTLQIIHKVVHNPEYTRDVQNGTNNRREIGDVLCGRDLDMGFIHNLLDKINFGNKIYKIKEHVLDIEHYKHLPGFTLFSGSASGPKMISYYIYDDEYEPQKHKHKVQTTTFRNELFLHDIMMGIKYIREEYVQRLLRTHNDNLEWRKKLLRNEISIDKFKFEIQKRHKSYEYKLEKARILDTFVSLAIDLIYRLNSNPKRYFDEITDELDTLREITNGFLFKLAKTYDYSIVHICPDFCIH